MMTFISILCLYSHGKNMNITLSNHGSPCSSRRALDSDFMQQRLPTWTPIFTPKTVWPFLLITGLVLTPIGITLLQISKDIPMHVIDYTHCKAIMNASLVTNVSCADIIQINPSSDKPCECLIEFSLNETLNGKVFMYYKLTNFYQNHRRFVESRDEWQLIGIFSSNECTSFREKNGVTIVPCGAVASSLFNDTLTLFSKSYGEVPVYNTGIAWPCDKDTLFRNPPNFKDKLKDYAKPIAWRKNLWELDPNNPDNNGLQNEDFIVWMRTEAFSVFTKLYRRVNHESQAVFKDGLPNGVYELKIVYNYPVTAFQGTKSFVLSTPTFIGNYTFLGYTYITVGSIYFLLGFVLLVVHLRNRSRRLSSIYNNSPRTLYT